jgi:hypothetical protein
VIASPDLARVTSLLEVLNDPDSGSGLRPKVHLRAVASLLGTPSSLVAVARSLLNSEPEQIDHILLNVKEERLTVFDQEFLCRYRHGPPVT